MANTPLTPWELKTVDANWYEYMNNLNAGLSVNAYLYSKGTQDNLYDEAAAISQCPLAEIILLLEEDARITADVPGVKKPVHWVMNNLFVLYLILCFFIPGKYESAENAHKYICDYFNDLKKKNIKSFPKDVQKHVADIQKYTHAYDISCSASDESKTVYRGLSCLTEDQIKKIHASPQSFLSTSILESSATDFYACKELETGEQCIDETTTVIEYRLKPNIPVINSFQYIEPIKYLWQAELVLPFFGLTFEKLNDQQSTNASKSIKTLAYNVTVDQSSMSQLKTRYFTEYENLKTHYTLKADLYDLYVLRGFFNTSNTRTKEDLLSHLRETFPHPYYAFVFDHPSNPSVKNTDFHISQLEQEINTTRESILKYLKGKTYMNIVGNIDKSAFLKRLDTNISLLTLGILNFMQNIDACLAIKDREKTINKLEKEITTIETALKNASASSAQPAQPNAAAGPSSEESICVSTRRSARTRTCMQACSAPTNKKRGVTYTKADLDQKQKLLETLIELQKNANNILTSTILIPNSPSQGIQEGGKRKASSKSTKPTNTPKPRSKSAPPATKAKPKPKPKSQSAPPSKSSTKPKPTTKSTKPHSAPPSKSTKPKTKPKPQSKKSSM